jgi:hypothetical protein
LAPRLFAGSMHKSNRGGLCITRQSTPTPKGVRSLRSRLFLGAGYFYVIPGRRMLRIVRRSRCHERARAAKTVMPGGRAAATRRFVAGATNCLDNPSSRLLRSTGLRLFAVPRKHGVSVSRPLTEFELRARRAVVLCAYGATSLHLHRQS